MGEPSSVSTPQFDLTAANAIQSIFTPGRADPWSRLIAADFIDLVLWHKSVRYPVAMPGGASAGDAEIVVPPILVNLERRDPGWLVPDVVISSEPRVLLPELLDPVMSEFTAFVVTNLRQVRAFLHVHEARWIGEQIRSRSAETGSHYVFDVPLLAANKRTLQLAAALQVPADRVYYLVDLVLKYLIYAERAHGGFYLTHPIRGKQSFYFLTEGRPSASAEMTIPFRIGPAIVDAARRRGHDWLTSTLHETRGYLHDVGVISLRTPGSVGRDTLRHLAARLRLPARVRGFDQAERAGSIASAGTGLLGSLASASMWPAVVGSALSIVGELWTGRVPDPLSRTSWLQWMLEWPLEDQAPKI